MRMHCPSRESTTKALTRSAPGLGGFGGLPRQGRPESHRREQLQQVCSGLGRGVLGTNGQVGLVGLGLGPLIGDLCLRSVAVYRLPPGVTDEDGQGETCCPALSFLPLKQQIMKCGCACFEDWNLISGEPD